MMSKYYILKDKEPIPADLMTWAEWFEDANRTVRIDCVGEVRISTVFIGLNHNFGLGDPLLFETMVFGGEMDGEQKRYSTWNEAESEHLKMIALVEEQKG